MEKVIGSENIKAISDQNQGGETGGFGAGQTNMGPDHDNPYGQPSGNDNTQDLMNPMMYLATENQAEESEEEDMSRTLPMMKKGPVQQDDGRMNLLQK